MKSTSNTGPDEMMDYPPEDEILEDNEFLTRRRNRKSSARSVGPKLPIIIGIVVIFLVILFLVTNKDNSDEAITPVLAEIQILKNSIKDLDARINKLDTLISDSEKAGKSISGRVSQLGSRISGVEKSITSISGRLKDLIEVKTTAPSEVKNDSFYVVKRGDTLFGIATRNGISVDKLREINGIGKSDTIYPGMKLSIE